MFNGPAGMLIKNPNRENNFPQYKANFKRLKEENGSKTHREIMSLLAEEYKRNREQVSAAVTDLSDQIGALGISTGKTAEKV